MKKLLFVCLMAGCQSLFAQNIDLSEIESLLTTHSIDSIDKLLLNKGFQKVKIQGGAPVMGLQLKEGWTFRSGQSSEAAGVTMLGRFTDTSGKTFYRLQTSNPFFYAHLMNQLPQNNYSYQGAMPKEKEAGLLFSNNRNEIIIRITSDFPAPYYYQINIGETVSDIGYFKPRKAVTKIGAVKKTAPTRKTVPTKKKVKTIPQY